MNKFIIAGVLAGSLLAACGGGGGTSSSTPTTLKPAAVVAHGTITGFGSVIVNGVHYNTSKADIAIAGSSGHRQDELSVGERVTVLGSVDAQGNHDASQVEYEAELDGVVTAINTAGKTFTALDQTVRVNESTVFVGLVDLAAMAVGDFVEVSGNRMADGSLLASFVKKEAPEAQVELRGSISALNATTKTFNIGRQSVDYSSASLRPTTFVPADGAFVEVEGNLNSSSVLVATKLKHESDFGDGEHGNGEHGNGEHGNEGELEGVIVDVAADHSSFHINATLVRVDSSTTYTGGTASDLVAGVKVEVEGVIATDDALQAKKVKFDAESHGADSRIEAAISAIDSAAKTFTVLGAVIHVADSTVFRDSRDGNHTFAFSSLVVGDFVSAGFSSKAGTLTASRVDRSKPRSASTLKAGVESFDATAQTLKIAGVAVNASGASYAVNDNPVTAKQFYDQLRAGSIVRVKGSFSGSLFTATEAELEVDK